MRSYKSIIPVLGGIRTCYQKCFFLDRLIIYQQLIRLRLVTQIFCHRIFNIGKRSASLLLGKLLAYRSIKANPAGTKKHTVVCLTAIYSRNMSFYDQFQCPFSIHRYMELTSQSVTGSFRNNPQNGIRMNHSTSYFIYRAVATYSYNTISPCVNRFSRQLAGMPRIFRKRDLQRTTAFLAHLFDHLRDLSLRTYSGNRIYYSLYRYFFPVHPNCL